MQLWLKISLILCAYGFMRELRPSEPYAIKFLLGPWRNITMEQLNRDILPLGTYSQLTMLVFFFLITDLLRYKPIIILAACIGIINLSLFLWTDTFILMQLVQLGFGVFLASEIAYYSYIYAKVDRSKYQQVTGHTRSAFLAGRFTASVLAQLLISFELMDYRELNYISLGTHLVSLVLAIILPKVKISLYFYTKTIVDDNTKHRQQQIHEINSSNISISTYVNTASTNSLCNNEVVVNTPAAAAAAAPVATVAQKEIIKFSVKKAFQLLWNHFKTAYTNKIVILWSIWWAAAMSGFLLVQAYAQLLWDTIHADSGYNGAVEAALTLLGALGAFAAGFLDNKQFNNSNVGFILLTICSIFEGGLLFWSAVTDNIWIVYVTYILFGAIYHFMITIASATIAKNLDEDSFALIFGINTLFGLIIQTIVTIIVISESGFSLDPRGQFMVFGAYFLVLAVIYTITGIIKFLLANKKK